MRLCQKHWKWRRAVNVLSGVYGDCSRSQWQCDDGVCVPHRWRCDAVSDCQDGSDEMDCCVYHLFLYICSNLVVFIRLQLDSMEEKHLTNEHTFYTISMSSRGFWVCGWLRVCAWVGCLWRAAPVSRCFRRVGLQLAFRVSLGWLEVQEQGLHPARPSLQWHQRLRR